ncbi:hypothetical protein YC2023_061525 [Brassica napus]
MSLWRLRLMQIVIQDAIIKQTDYSSVIFYGQSLSSSLGASVLLFFILSLSHLFIPSLSSPLTEMKASCSKREVTAWRKKSKRYLCKLCKSLVHRNVQLDAMPDGREMYNLRTSLGLPLIDQGFQIESHNSKRLSDIPTGKVS